MNDSAASPLPSLTPEQADLRELVIRLARVQAKIIDPVKATAGDERFDKKDKSGRLLKSYRFADLVTVLATVRPALGAEGLALTQELESSAQELRLLTSLRYGCAQITSCWVQPMPAMKKDRNGDDMPMSQAQGIGAVVTYARRKSILALVGVQDDEQDDPDLGTREHEPSERKERIKEQANARAQQQEHQEDDLGPLLAQTRRFLSDLAMRNDYAIDERAALQACLDKRGWDKPTRERLEALQAALLDPSKEDALMKIIKPHLSQRRPDPKREATPVEVERAAAAWAKTNMLHDVEDHHVRDMITLLAGDLGQDLGAMTPKAWAVQLARFQDPKQTPTLQALFAGVFVPF